MSDFSCQFVEGLVPTLTATLDVDGPGVTNFAKAFIIPAVAGLNSAGIGPENTVPSDSFGNAQATAQLTDLDTVHFDDFNTNANNNRVGAWLLEYLGPAGGVNEVIVRDVKVFSGTAGTFESSAIAGITNINKCVPFATYVGVINNGSYQAHSAQIEIVNNGVNNVVRVTKVDATQTLQLVVYVVEFVGTNWTVQKVSHTFTAANTNQDEAIASVGNIANAFVYSTWKATGNQCAQNLFYVWLTSPTNLRHRLHAITGSPVAVSYVISNPQLSVEVVGADPDGVMDLTAGASAPEERSVNCTAVPNLGTAIALAHMGSNVAAISDRAGGQTLVNFLDNDTIRLRRSINAGDTEYKIQVIKFDAVVGLSIDSVTPLVDGSNFTITGNFGAVTAVTLGGVAQPAVSADSTTIVRTAALSTLKYGAYDLTVTAGGVVTQPDVTISPPATKNFVNLSTLTAPAGRLTSTPDLAPGDQVEWSNVIGGTIADVTVFDDGSFSSSPGVTAFDFRVNDGSGWGASQTQTINDAPVDTLNFIRRIVTDFTRLIVFTFTNIEHDT